jgi:hypothetical protein
MAKLTVKIDEKTKTFEGSLDELKSIIDRLLKPEEKPLKSANLTQLEKRFPKEKELIKFIKQNPGYDHGLADVQIHFFGMRFSRSGETKRLFTTLDNRLKAVRKKIEQSEDGKFINEWVYPLNEPKYKIYRFKR